MSARKRARTAVVITRNFEANLRRIELFLEAADAGEFFDRLLDDLLQRVVPLLERSPKLGPPWEPSDLSHESRFVLDRIRKQLGAEELRQLLRGDFLLLYLLSPGQVALLSIRHARERGFQLAPSARKR